MLTDNFWKVTAPIPNGYALQQLQRLIPIFQHQIGRHSHGRDHEAGDIVVAFDLLDRAHLVQPIGMIGKPGRTIEVHRTTHRPEDHHFAAAQLTQRHQNMKNMRILGAVLHRYTSLANSRLRSRSFTVARLSALFLPFPRPISILNFRFRMIDSGTIV